MILTTDGRGEFILVAECLNLYEEFANKQEDFTSINNVDVNETGHNTFAVTYTYDQLMGTWPTGLEWRVLVKSQHVYGKKRRFKDLKFDMSNASGPDLAIMPYDTSCDVLIRIRAITTDFDPATITWNWAITQSNLGLSAEHADYLMGTGGTSGDGTVLPSRRGTPLAAWNELDNIYGFELRIEPSGSEREWLQAQWHAKLWWPWLPVGYVILA